MLWGLALQYSFLTLEGPGCLLQTGSCQFLYVYGVMKNIDNLQVEGGRIMNQVFQQEQTVLACSNSVSVPFMNCSV